MSTKFPDNKTEFTAEADKNILPAANDQNTNKNLLKEDGNANTFKQIKDVLKQTQQRFQQTFNQAPYGIAILKGKSFIVEMANPAYLQLVDKTEKEFVGKPLFESLPEVQETVHSLLDSVLITGVPYHGNEMGIPVKRNGVQEIFYFDFIYHPLKDENGSISGVMVTVIEVTEKVIAKLKIEQSEARFHNLIYSSPSAIGILYGEDLKITIGNDAIFEIWGKGKEITGKPYFEALPELAEQGYREIFAEVYTSGFPFNAVETPVNILQNGVMTLKYYNFLLYPQKDISGTIEGIGIIATEVTSQAMINKQIQESEESFRLLADSMPQQIWTADAEGKLTYFNKSVFDYSGLSQQQLIEEGWLSIVHPGDKEQNIKKWKESVRTGEDFLFEHRFQKYTGEYRWHLSRAKPQKDENGNIQIWVGTSTDIDEQKTFSGELTIQVNDRTKELKQKNIDLEKLNKELQSFAYISSHDLQEPLRKIQTFSTLLTEREIDGISDTGKEYLGRIQSSAYRMQTLINDLLAYSRTSIAERIYENTDLQKIVEEVKSDLKEELEHKHAIIETQEMCEVHVIRFQFRQLLLNLISNSLKFSRPEQPPHIIIKCEAGTGDTFQMNQLSNEIKYCHISIADNGIGFEQHFSEKIFELFQRLHGKNEYNGTGIGLAIVKRIVENHEGFITATSNINQGAIFNIYIPTLVNPTS